MTVNLKIPGKGNCLADRTLTLSWQPLTADEAQETHTEKPDLKRAHQKMEELASATKGKTPE